MIHLVTGGARAGKSTYVLQQAEATAARSIAFVATAEPMDAEMEDRIRRHQAERGPRWATIEEPIALERVLLEHPHEAAVVDCLTLWVANLIFHKEQLDDAAIDARIHGLVDALRRVRVPTWLVTNEVGLGIVPADPLSRRYRDHLGRCNQRVAAVAERVTFVVSGLPLALKQP